MENFPPEFWPWIVVHFALSLIALVRLYSMSPRKGPSPFT